MGGDGKEEDRLVLGVLDPRFWDRIPEGGREEVSETHIVRLPRVT